MIMFTCSQFNIYNKDSSCKKKDRIILQEGRRKKRYSPTTLANSELPTIVSYCQASAPKVTTSSNLKVSFFSDRKRQASGALCTAQCTTGPTNITTVEPDTTTTTEPDTTTFITTNEQDTTPTTTTSTTSTEQDTANTKSTTTGSGINIVKTPTQPQLNLPNLCLGFTKNDFTPPPTENSMSAIFQLLLARF